MRKLLALAALGGALLLAPTMAQADYRVGYTDLDLTTRPGRAKLDRRILSAVQLACGSASSVDPAGRNQMRRCIATELAEARLGRDRAVATAETRARLLALSDR